MDRTRRTASNRAFPEGARTGPDFQQPVAEHFSLKDTKNLHSCATGTEVLGVRDRDLGTTYRYRRHADPVP